MRWLYNLLAKRYESKRVTELLLANNRLVERRRALMQMMIAIQKANESIILSRYKRDPQHFEYINDMIAVAILNDAALASKRD